MQSINNSKKSIYYNLLICFAIALLSSLATAAVFAIVMTVFSVGTNYSALFSTLSYIVGCFVGGIFFGKLNKSKGMIFGSLIGIAVFLVSLIIALIINKSSLSIITLFHLLGCVLSAAIGGIVSVNNVNKNVYKTGKFK